ncbi:MAG: glycosyl transferase family 1 [Desulfovibrio sp.]|nr:glycosyl transferase family 1 [Desulfovibrio sp.]
MDSAMAEGPGATGGRRCLLVLGMHRSGTSALARGLAVLGASLGDELLPALPCNPRGFFEDRDIYAFNKRLLAALGLTWASAAPLPPQRLLELAQGEAGEAALGLLRAKTEGRELPAFKAPRLSRLMPFWRPLLGAAGLAPSCVLALRHPDAVAASLEQRDGMEPEAAHALWLRHTLDALDGSRALSRVLVAYERLLAAPGRELARVGHALGLEADRDALAVFTHDFLDAGLCHHGATGDAKARGPFSRLALRLHAGLEPLAMAAPEALEAGLGEGRLGRLRQECAAALAVGGLS